MPHLDPGTYRFCLLDVPREYLPECWDDVATLAEADEVAVAPGGNGPLKFRLVRRANISGTVTRPAGSTASIGLIAHRFRLGRWEPVAFAPTGPDGGYRITGLDADTYRVCAYGYDILQTCWRTGSQVDDATDIVLATGQYRRRVDLAPGQAGFVSGTLPDVYLGAEGYPSSHRLASGRRRVAVRDERRLRARRASATTGPTRSARSRPGPTWSAWSTSIPSS